MGINEIPKFFNLPQGKKISFKVKGSTKSQANKRKQLLENNSTISDFENEISERKDFNTNFSIKEKSQEGVPKTYTPEQVYNYKSQFKRYEKGMELVQNGKISQDKNSPGNYKILSDKAPKGYWNVNKKKKPVPNKAVCLSDNVFVTLNYFGDTHDTDLEDGIGTGRGASIEYDDNNTKEPAQSLINERNFDEARLISAEYSETQSSGDKTISFFRNANRTIVQADLLTCNLGWRSVITAQVYVRGDFANRARIKVRVTYECPKAFKLFLTGYENAITSGGEYEIKIDTYNGVGSIAFSLSHNEENTEDVISVKSQLEILECNLISESNITPLTLNKSRSFVKNYGNSAYDGEVLTYSATYTESFYGLYGSFSFTTDAIAPFTDGGSITIKATGNSNIVFSRAKLGISIEIEYSGERPNDIAGVLTRSDGSKSPPTAYKEISIVNPSNSGKEVSFRVIFDVSCEVEKTFSIDGQIEVAITIDKSVGDTCTYRYFDDIEDNDGNGNGNGGGNGGGDGNGGSGNDSASSGDDFECNCPDATKEKYLLPTNTLGNEPVYKSWKDSNAGAKDGNCQHVWALRILSGLVGNKTGQIKIPTDIPIEISESTSFPGEQNPQVANQKSGSFKNWKMNKTTKGDKF